MAGTSAAHAADGAEDDLPEHFDIDGNQFQTEPVDPWNVIRRGVVIKPYTNWWDPADNSTDRRPCTLIGYTKSFTYSDGKVD